MSLSMTIRKGSGAMGELPHSEAQSNALGYSTANAIAHSGKNLPGLLLLETELLTLSAGEVEGYVSRLS